jgi:hypothetical protein
MWGRRTYRFSDPEIDRETKTVEMYKLQQQSMNFVAAVIFAGIADFRPFFTDSLVFG